MIMPYFLYCAEIWRCCNQTLRGSVEVLYRHCLRIVLNDIAFKPKLSNAVVYTMNNALPLSLDFQLRSACILYSIIKLKSNSVLSKLFHLKSAARQTRDTIADVDRLETPFTQLERDRSAFSWWGCTLWNIIPSAAQRTLTIFAVYTDSI